MNQKNQPTDKEVEELSPEDKEELSKVLYAFKQAISLTLKNGKEMNPMCVGCAFKLGTVANNKTRTVLTAVKCVLAEEPFYCHEKPHVCNGWLNVINANYEESFDTENARLIKENEA